MREDVFERIRTRRVFPTPHLIHISGLNLTGKFFSVLMMFLLLLNCERSIIKFCVVILAHDLGFQFEKSEPMILVLVNLSFFHYVLVLLQCQPCTNLVIYVFLNVCMDDLQVSISVQLLNLDVEISECVLAARLEKNLIGINHL